MFQGGFFWAFFLDAAVIRVSAVRLSTHSYTSRHLGGERVHTPRKPQKSPKIPIEPSSSLFVFKSTPSPTVINIPAGLVPHKRPVPISKVAGSCSLQTQAPGAGKHGEPAALLGAGCGGSCSLCRRWDPPAHPPRLGAGSRPAESRREATETASPQNTQAMWKSSPQMCSCVSAGKARGGPGWRTEGTPLREQ